MNLESIAFVFVIIAGVGIYRKVYYENKLKNKNRKADNDILFRRYYDIESLFPLRKSDFSEKDLPDLKKANVGLLLFYISLAIVCLMSAIYFKFYLR